MAYSAVWSEAVPAGSLAASDLDQAIRDAKRDIRERLAGVFGMADWSADPLAPVSLKFPNNAAAIIARNAANSADLAVIKLNAANIVEIAGGKLTVDGATGDTVIGGAAGVGGTALTIRSGTPTPSAMNLIVPDNWYWDFRRKAALGGSALLISDTGTVQLSNERLILVGSTANFPTLIWPDGILPTIALVDGFMWAVGNDLFRRIGGVTKKVTFA